MKTTKKVHKRSKRVLGRAPQYTYHVKETKMIEDYPGGPKRKHEIIHAVDSFCSH